MLYKAANRCKKFKEEEYNNNNNETMQIQNKNPKIIQK